MVVSASAPSLSVAAPVPPTPTSPIQRPPSPDTSYLFFLCNSFLSSFLAMTHSPQPALSAASRLPSISLSHQIIPSSIATSTTSTSASDPARIPSSSSKQSRLSSSSRLSAQNMVLTSLLWSLAIVCVAVDAQPAPCVKSHPFVGYRGRLSPDLGVIEIIDDCNFAHETRAGFNNASIRGLRWGGQFQDSQGNLQIFGVVSSSAVSGSDLPVPYRLLPGVTWSSFDFLTMQSNSGELVAAVPLGRPFVPTTTTTTTRAPIASPTPPPSQVVVEPPTTTTTAPPTRTIVISPPGTAITNNTALPLKAVPTLTDPQSPLVVRLGPNTNYPGLLPTFLNVSLWINDTESPVLVLTRGKSYTFSIQSGTAHPVYITTSREGGKKAFGANSTETILVGNATTSGTISTPLEWVFYAPLRGSVQGLADDAAVFYQCYVHRRMGWKIVFADLNATDAGATSGAGVAARGGFAGALVAVGVFVVSAVLLVL